MADRLVHERTMASASPPEIVFALSRQGGMFSGMRVDIHLSLLVPQKAWLGTSRVPRWLRLFSWCCLILGESGTLAAAEPFVPARSAVLLLPGLPGDVASETLDRQQLRGWLDWLGKSPVAPSSVAVFWDAEKSLNIPETLVVKLLPARRESFLALGKTLAGQAHPLVVVIWGHGGKQQQTPVFHVRKPRITPTDLLAFADQTAGAESRRVLYFPGSPLVLDEEVVITLPTGGKAPVLPAHRESRGEPLAWKIEWTHPDPQSMCARPHVELVRGEPEAAEALRLQTQLRDLLGGLGKGIIVKMEP